MYTDLASVYDALMQDVDYDGWSDYLYRLMLNAPAPVLNVLEFGCGTGAVTTRLAKKGLNVTAVDLSEEMLCVADEKAAQENLGIRFLLGDMSDFVIHDTFDAVISACDSVNYLRDLNALAGFFSGAYDALHPGGLLLFDMSTAHKLKKTIGENTFVYNLDDVFCVWENTQNQTSVVYDLTFFVKEADGRYARFEESQEQFIFSQKDVYQLLRRCGFKNIRFYAFGTFLAGSEECERLQICAQKP